MQIASPYFDSILNGDGCDYRVREWDRNAFGIESGKIVANMVPCGIRN